MPTTRQNLPKILAIIPARGGSKGIPKKNLVPLLGKPLIAWTIQAARESKYIDRIVVSSDSQEILAVAKKIGAEIIARPKPLAADHVVAALVVEHALSYLKNRENYQPEIIAYLQPTSPLRSTFDLNQAISLFLKKKARALISVFAVDNKYLKAFALNQDGYLQGVSKPEIQFGNRQSAPPLFMPNGAIYLIWRKIFKKTGELFAHKTIPFVMSAKKSIDIDTLKDLNLAAKFLKT